MLVLIFTFSCGYIQILLKYFILFEWKKQYPIEIGVCEICKNDN